MTTEELQRIESISKKITVLQAEIKEREEAVKNLRSTLAPLLQDKITYAGDFVLDKQENARFDDTLAKKNLTPTQYDLISVTKADSKKARAILSEEELELCLKRFDPKVVIKLAD